MFSDNVSIIWLISSLKTMPGDIISVPKMKARGNSVILLCLFLYFLSYSLLWFPADNICLMANLKLQAKLWKPTREALCLWTRLERETMTKNGSLSWNSKFLPGNDLHFVLIAGGRRREGHLTPLPDFRFFCSHRPWIVYICS